jgi:alpha-glucosidase
MMALRKSRPELSGGDIEFLEAPEGVLAFARTKGKDRLLCLFNMETAEQAVEGMRFTDTVASQNMRVDGYRIRLGISGFCFLKG